MKIKAVLFDLDGTLLPLTQDVFAATYFKTLTKKFCEYGFNPAAFSESLKEGVYAMATNDGSVTNEERFFKVFSNKIGTDMHKYDNEFLSFYQNEFQTIKSVCGFSEYSKKAVDTAKAKGFLCVAATAPMFPKIATDSRIKWAGLNPNDFVLCTTFENFGYSKPNKEYYAEILRRINAKPEECVMIGNDVCEDMSAETLGIKVFLLNESVVNRKDLPTEHYKQGGYKEMAEFIESL